MYPIVISPAHGQKTPYLPVLIMHGLFSREPAFDKMESFIKAAHAGTEVHVLTSHEGLSSVFTSMEEQLKGMTDEINDIKREHGIRDHHLLCFSQGVLLCRAYLMQNQDHNVRNFISLSGPMFGEYGLTMLGNWLPGQWVLGQAWKLMYTNKFQESISISNYWRDPLNYNTYLTHNAFLPKLNNETHNDLSVEHRENFLKIDNLVLIGGPQDGIIEPWQSALFEFYEIDEISMAKETSETYHEMGMSPPKIRVVPLVEQRIYREDTFGLKTLHEQGRLHRHVMEKIHHLRWTKNKKVFDQCIEKYLD